MFILYMCIYNIYIYNHTDGMLQYLTLFSQWKNAYDNGLIFKVNYSTRNVTIFNMVRSIAIVLFCYIKQANMYRHSVFSHIQSLQTDMSIVLAYFFGLTIWILRWEFMQNGPLYCSFLSVFDVPHRANNANIMH